MADDFDQFPVGTTTAFGGLSSDDPLYDWASNLRPSDMQQFIHDPEGFKQNMVNQGVPPPDHHYDENMQPITPDGQPIVRTKPNGKIQGNITDYLNPSAAQAVAPPQRPGTRALGFGENPEGASPWDQSLERQFRDQPREAGKGSLGPPKPEGKPYQERLPGMAGPTTGPGVPAPPVKKEAPDAGPTTKPYVPEKEQEAEKEVAKDEQKTKKDEKKVEAYSPEAISDFAKSLAGVKMPERPKLAPPQSQGVRAPVSIHPQFQNLLAMVGARPQGPVPNLMRLLGRA